MGLMDMMMMGLAPGSALGASGASSIAQQLSPLRALRYLHPQNAPMHAPSAPRGGGYGQGDNPFFGQQQGDYSQYTYNPGANASAEQALSPYGLHPLSPNQVNPFTFLPNHGFFANHPNLSNGLEGAAYGALAAHSGQTTGDTIQSVLGSLIQGPMMRHAAWERQFAAPFDAARPLEAMRDLQDKRQLNDSEIQYHHAMVQSLQDKSEYSNAMLGVNQEKADTDQKYKDAMGSANLLKQENAKLKIQHMFDSPMGAGTQGRIIAGKLKASGLDPESDPEAYWSAASSMKQAMDTASAGGKAYAAKSAHDQAGLADDTVETETSKHQDKYESKKTDFISKQKPSFWGRLGIDPQDSAAQDTWYQKAHPMMPRVQKSTPSPTPSPQASTPQANPYR